MLESVGQFLSEFGQFQTKNYKETVAFFVWFSNHAAETYKF